MPIALETHEENIFNIFVDYMFPPIRQSWGHFVNCIMLPIPLTFTTVCIIISIYRHRIPHNMYLGW